MSNKKRGVMYVGCTSDLDKRVYQHKNKIIKGFTSKYNLTKLVYFETTDNATSMILREKQLKRYKRQWKFNLIEQGNPNWDDLDPGINPG